MAKKEYIERGALIAEYDRVHIGPAGGARKLMVDAPAADVTEVRHGEWKADTDEYEICATEFTCSCCKESFASSEMTDEDFLQMMKYCPNCGAKMDGERKEQK